MTETLPSNTTQLRTRIESAFRDVPYPGDNHITWMPISDSVVHGELKAVYKFFRGKHWREVSFSELMHDYEYDEKACLAFMHPMAFRFFLPAFLLFCLDQTSAKDESRAIAEMLVTMLTPPPKGDVDAYHSFEDRIKVLNVEEKDAVSGFLDYCQCALGLPPEGSWIDHNAC